MNKKKLYLFFNLISKLWAKASQVKKQMQKKNITESCYCKHILKELCM